jgi:hypothetical protein
MKNSPHPGLFPPGFSAEHLGPNDYYYWDDFWSASGLRCAASMLERSGNVRRSKIFEAESLRFERDIWKSIVSIPEKKAEGAIPASPNRRLEAGEVGSLVADYPLHMTRPGNPRILKTVEFLMENCFHSGGFFQDMIHSTATGGKSPRKKRRQCRAFFLRPRPATWKRSNSRKDKMLKICMFTNTYLPHVGGVARSVSFFSEDLIDKGHDERCGLNSKKRIVEYGCPSIVRPSPTSVRQKTR